MNISSLLSPDAPRPRMPSHQTGEHTGPELYSSTPSDVPIQAPSPIHPLNQAALWENGGYDVESVEKAMSKSSSTSSGMGGYYDPIHDQAEPPQITMPVLSPGGRGISLGSLGGPYDSVHGSSSSSSGMGSSSSNSSHPHSMGPPPPSSSSQHYSPAMVAPLGPPPLPHSLPAMQSHAQQQVPLSPPTTQQHQRHYEHDYDNHHHHQHHQHHHNTASAKATYPNVLNESTTQVRDPYSQSEWEQSAQVESSGKRYDPLGEHRSAETSMPDVPQPRRRKRVWEDESDVGVEEEEERVSAPLPPPPPPPQQQPNTYPALVPEPELAHADPEPEPEPEPEPMDEDNPLQRENEDPPLAEGDDTARIHELRILLEQYPLYKPAHLEFIALVRRKYHVLRTEEARSELESVRSFANETMQMGEQGWLEWIEDEDKACHDLEGRLKVIDLCSKAVEEQPMSAKLWKVYVDQLEGQYRKWVAAVIQNGSGEEEGDEMDEGLGEIFTWDMLIGVYAQAVDAIKDHITEGHLLWDRYLELLMEDLDVAFRYVTHAPISLHKVGVYLLIAFINSSESKLQQTRNALLTRLKTPHPNIDATFSVYSTFVTNYENANYEKIMVSTNKIFAASKSKYDEREMHELQLRRAIQAADESGGSEENITAEWYAWKSYLDWELALPKKKMDVELAMALFERAVMRYDYRGEAMWDWYLDFLVCYRIPGGCCYLFTYMAGVGRGDRCWFFFGGWGLISRSCRQKKQIDHQGYYLSWNVRCIRSRRCQVYGHGTWLLWKRGSRVQRS